MNIKTTVDSAEVAKFSQHASKWWDLNGPLKTLHDINPARLEFMCKHATVSDKTILDIGCGGGVLSEAMAKSGGHVTGLDVEPDSIETARQHALTNGLSIQYVCSPIENYLPDESGVFDVITCMEMLEHVTDPQLVIQHASRLLKPGGLLFLSTINRTIKAYASAIVAAEYVLNLLPRQTHDYEKFIKPSELAMMLRNVGLDMFSISGLSYNPLNRAASLQDSVAVNYLAACRSLST